MWFREETKHFFFLNDENQKVGAASRKAAPLVKGKAADESIPVAVKAVKA